MSSTTITVNPRQRTARSPPPAAKTDDTTASKETILLRNPLPKYSFQPKLDKKAVKIGKEVKDIVDNKEVPTNETGRVATGSKPPDINVGDKTDIKTESGSKEKSDVMRENIMGRQSEMDTDFRIGVLVNSFPQTSVQNVANIPSPVKQTVDLQTMSGEKEEETVKLFKEKPKPVNIVDPISSTNRLSHSYSESAISMSSSSLQRSSGHITLSHGQTGLSGNAIDQNVSEAENSGSETGSDAVIAFVPGESRETVSCNCKDKIKHLEEEKQLLKQQLEVQLQVNCELKKLLVASLGDDLHHRVERLTRDKALLSLELGDYSKKVEQDYEHLDKISIQADMWRSKYLASRVMTDELASAKAFYTMQYQECQVALQQLLNERHELRANLFETYRGLHQIRGAFDPLNSDNSSNQLSSKHVIDLARTNQQLTDAIKYRLLPSHVTAALSNKIEPDWHDYLTKAEAHARELLARDVRPEDFRHLVPRSLTAPGGMVVDRFHPCSRFDNLTINVCCKCKGDVTIV